MFTATELAAQATATVSLVRVPVQEFMKSSGFTSIHKEVRINSNGYPYITFITANNVSENIYFSKKASEMVTEGELVVRGWFDSFKAAEVKNAAGEMRTKLVSANEGGNRLDASDLF